MNKTNGLCECGCKFKPKRKKSRFIRGHRSKLYSVRPIQESFFRYVNKTDTCWLWTGGTMTSGYGHIRTRFNRIPKNISAHRYSYEFHKGEIPKGKLVLHHCDIKLCVNPAHLWIGTQTDNMRDASAKGLLGKSHRIPPSLSI